MKYCELCEIDAPLTFHHLIPKSCHTNKWFKKKYDRKEMLTRGAWLCRPCHSHIHRHFSEKELGRSLNTIQTLLNEKVISDFAQWQRKKKLNH